MNEKNDIVIKLPNESLQALFEGKKVIFDYVGQPRVTLITERYGVFMTHEKLAELRRKIGFQALADTDGFFKEILGDELAEKIFNK